MICKAINAEKWLWPIFGCKLGQSVPIGMKLEFDVKHHLLHVYTKFETDISTHVENKPGKLRKIPKRAKIIAKIPKIISLQKQNLCWEVYSRPPVYQIWRIYFDLWGHDCKKWVWPTFGCKLGQSDPIVMQLKLDMSCHLLYIPSFKLISQSMLKKSSKNADGRTDGRTDRQTDGHCHGIIRPFFKRAYEKW